ncbi:hypothetical protein DPMN_002301 [Dreissena polymorpha]|uniref:Uncharacterized protein n=1 Tax=Dreissena polymorpha TaxID=45954 RepID=A0A9D4ML14_DREPO|nr:hypothetical protein DPMN_002301 [Dreissena polymorpha]
MRYVKSIARITVLFFACRILRASEPMCLSRFDYDEKMLLKILRFEDALEKFDKKISDIVDMFDNNERKRNSETKEAVDKAKLDVKQIMEHIQQNISNVLIHDSRNIRTQLQEVETLRAKMREELKCKGIVSTKCNNIDKCLQL